MGALPFEGKHDGPESERIICHAGGAAAKSRKENTIGGIYVAEGR